MSKGQLTCEVSDIEKGMHEEFKETKEMKWEHMFVRCKNRMEHIVRIDYQI
jgi:hypothetical protein